MSNFDTYMEVISILEKRGMSEEQIISTLEYELTPKNRDLYFDINEALYEKGYKTQFEVPELNNKKFNSEEYQELIKHVKKYQHKTEALMEYLKEISFLNFSILNTSFILIKHLPDLLEFLISNNIEYYEDESLYDIYFANYLNVPIRSQIEDIIFEKIGIYYLELDYTRFHLDLEFLLWCIAVNDGTDKAYRKVNTIKVACNIIDSKFVMWNDKLFYDKKIQKNLMKYISLAPKEIKDKIVKKYQDILCFMYDDGYKLFFNLL